jgi:hypothetical protein
MYGWLGALHIGIRSSSSNIELVWDKMSENWESSLFHILIYVNLGKMVKILRENPQICEKILF